MNENITSFNGSHLNKDNTIDHTSQMAQEVMEHAVFKVKCERSRQEVNEVEEMADENYLMCENSSSSSYDKTGVCQVDDVAKYYSSSLSERIMEEVYCCIQQLHHGNPVMRLCGENMPTATENSVVSSHATVDNTLSLDTQPELDDVALCDTLQEIDSSKGSSQSVLSDLQTETGTRKIKRITKKEKKRKKLLKKLPSLQPPWSFEEMGFWTSRGQVETDASRSLGCPVCFEVFFNPYNCVPCNHSYCEPCLRRMAKYNSDRRRPHRCPICRIVISRCAFNQDIHDKVLINLPEEYQRRVKWEQNNRYMSHPLPFTSKLPDIKAITDAISERQRNHEMREQAESYWKMVLTTAIFFCSKGLVILGLVWFFTLFSEDGFITNVWEYFWEHLYQYNNLDQHKKAEITNHVFILLLGFILLCSVYCNKMRPGLNNRR